MNKFKLQINKALDDFLKYRQALGYSAVSHEKILRRFTKYIAETVPDCSSLTQEIVMSWYSEQSGKLSEKASCVRQFAEYLNAVGIEAYVLPRKIAPFSKSQKDAAYVFTDDELRRLFIAIDDMPENKAEPFMTDVLPVMFRLTYTCGLRPNESRKLLCKDINLDTGEIIIAKTKNNKERLVVMSDSMTKLCRKYDSKRVVFSKNSGYFFPRLDGGTFTAEVVQQQFKDCWRRANQDIYSKMLPAVRVYDLRHRFATAALVRWLEQGKDIKTKLVYLRTYMGHESFDDTLYYVHLLPEHLVYSSGVSWNEFYHLIPEVVKW
jgi:integrase